MLRSMRGSKGAAAGPCRCSALPMFSYLYCYISRVWQLRLSRDHADDTHGEGRRWRGQCRNWGIKYPNNCTGLYSDLIEIISSCFVSLFQGCILHFSSEQLGSLWSLGGRVAQYRIGVIHLFRHMQQYAAHPWIIMKANIYTFSKPFFSQTKALVSSCH